MGANDRVEILQTLAITYLREKENSKVWHKDHSRGCLLALGKLQGACMAFDLDFEEVETGIVIFTRNRRKTVVNVELG